MAYGYMGSILKISLIDGKIETEKLSDDICRDFIGGYGIGARLLYDRIPAHADPLGPDNILGILTGPLTGTAAITGSRFTVVAKSPKTAGGWGDANCGGFFGPHMKFAGVDGVLFRGISPKPVYLLIEAGKAQLLDAGDLWGMGVSPLEDLLKQRHGKGVQVCSIGPAGEKLSLTACIMNDKERAAGRSGLGAVMGSKKVKAIVVKGKMEVPVADADKMKQLRKTYLKQATGPFSLFSQYGTAGLTEDAVLSGDAPVKNWGGAGMTDFAADQIKKINGDAVIGVEGYKKYGCWRCPIACGGKVIQKSGKFALEFNDGVGHKPEYETLAMFGSNLLNDDLASIIKVNEICNNFGLDTIAVASVIGYAIECYENGLISKDQADGLELTWGNADAIVAMTEKIGKREGFGNILADGVAAAAKALGGIGVDYQVHVGGEEVPAHDPKFMPDLASVYLLSPTPGRHTQGGEMITPPGLDLSGGDRYSYTGKAEMHYKLLTLMEVVNAAGICMFGYVSYPVETLVEELSAVTGIEYDLEKLYEIGMRIFTMRHVFNLREGINPLERNVPGRLVGEPPLKEGNVKEVTVDYKKLNQEFLEFIGWDTQSTVPGEESLKKLGLEAVISDLKK